MNRILGIFAVSSVLLTACGGGGLQSPNFQPVLKGVDITFTAQAGTAIVAPGRTLKLDAQGLYSTPPGTRGGSGLVACPAPEQALLCSLGAVTGVVFSVDAAAGAGNPIASVDANGLVTGLRRGQTTVRARRTGFTDATEALIVNGPVLTEVTIDALDVKNNTVLTARPAAVPTGRSIALTGRAQCSTGFAGGPAGTSPQGPSAALCTNQNYSFNWSLPIATPADTVDFTPNPPVGQTIAVKTKKIGGFNVELRFTNEEGDIVNRSIGIDAQARVLDDIIVQADPAQPAPVPVVKGATTRFVAKGLFSDGVISDISSVNLAKDANGACIPLTWSADANAVGQFEIDQDTACPNAAVLVTSASANRIGSSGINARGMNSETSRLVVEDRVPVDVREVDLLALTRICLRSDAPDQCTGNTQVELSPTPETAANARQYVVRGTFRGDTPGLERNIDPSLVPLVFTKGADSAANGQINIFTDVAPANGVPDSAVSVVGLKTGPARLIATLDSAFAPAISERSKSTDLVVLENACRDQLFTINGTTAAMTKSDTVGLSDVTNAPNVIDTNPASFGTYAIGPSVLGGTLTMSFNRPDRVVTPATGGRKISFVLNDRSNDVKSIMSIQTLDAAGVQVDNIAAANITRVAAVGRAAGFFTYSANTLLPFTGVRLTVRPPLLLGLLAAALPVGVIDVLASGGSFDVDAYTACADAL